MTSSVLLSGYDRIPLARFYGDKLTLKVWVRSGISDELNSRSDVGVYYR